MKNGFVIGFLPHPFDIKIFIKIKKLADSLYLQLIHTYPQLWIENGDKTKPFYFHIATTISFCL